MPGRLARALYGRSTGGNGPGNPWDSIRSITQRPAGDDSFQALRDGLLRPLPASTGRLTQGKNVATGHVKQVTHQALPHEVNFGLIDRAGGVRIAAYLAMVPWIEAGGRENLAACMHR